MRRVLLALPLLAGLAAALVLTLPSVARAWDIHSLPDGYLIVGHIKNGDCTTYQIRGYSAAIDLSDCRPDFQTALDAWIETTCPQAVCHPAPPVTTAASSVPAPVTTTAPAPAPPVTTTVAAPVDTAPVTTVAAPAPVAPAPPTVTQTVIIQTSVTTTIVDPTINQRLSTDEARIAQLENPPVAGAAPLGEPKNLSPFIA